VGRGGRPLAEDYISRSPEELQAEGLAESLALFHGAAERVPAYRDFLRKRGIDHRKITRSADFQQVPSTDKHNYLRAYPLRDLSWDGELSRLSVLSSSSGSTGEPFFWPRGRAQILEGVLSHELILGEIFDAGSQSTLFIVCFAMGAWIAGAFTLECVERLSDKGYPILTVTPGLDAEVTLALFKRLADQFDQVVICGYPPYVKDLLDGGAAAGIDWARHRVRFLFAAEGFSERWRDYVHAMVGSQRALDTSISMYGSADAAILAHETPLTIAIRRMVADDPARIQLLFDEARLPTLAQYDPRLKYFEQVERMLLFTTRSGLPLIRYRIGDEGGVYSFAEMRSRVAALGGDFAALLRPAGDGRPAWPLPFVYLFGRSDLTVSLYGLLIYPEHVKYGLERAGLEDRVTGKFLLSIELDEALNPSPLIKVELARGAEPTAALAALVQRAIMAGLREVNSEYARLERSLGARVAPVIRLMPHGDSRYFAAGKKQRWVEHE